MPNGNEHNKPPPTAALRTAPGRHGNRDGGEQRPMDRRRGTGPAARGGAIGGNPGVVIGCCFCLHTCTDWIA